MLSPSPLNVWFALSLFLSLSLSLSHAPREKRRAAGCTHSPCLPTSLCTSSRCARGGISAQPLQDGTRACQPTHWADRTRGGPEEHLQTSSAASGPVRAQRGVWGGESQEAPVLFAVQSGCQLPLTAGGTQHRCGQHLPLHHSVFPTALCVLLHHKCFIEWPSEAWEYGNVLAVKT